MSPSRPRLNGLSSGLDAAKCKIGSEPAMTPGAANIRYDRDLRGRLGPLGRFKSAVVAFMGGQADV
ncbi:MAG: hypothetical protein HOH89_05540 [Alphaproteobacteria bacterium]|nr:hypothetical protein [Alphaproteobacteria bacterium]